MHITELKISGFRSFADEISIPLKNKLSAFIGLNSSGKTTALEALRKVFGTSGNEKELVKEDFHIPNNEEIEADERQLSIEVIIEFDDDDDGVPHFFNHMIVKEEDGDPYLRVRLEATWYKSELIPDGTIESNIYFIKVPEGYDETENKQFFQSAHRSLIQVLYVPAIRRPADQIKYASGSILYRILRRINWDDDFKNKFKTHVEEISSLFQEQADVKSVETSIKGFWNKFHKDKRYERADISFGGNDFDSILKKLEIAFSPTGTGKPYRVDDLGEGYRSLFYLTLVCSMLEIEESLSKDDDEFGSNRPLLTLLAIEEPENHIAPQLLGRVISILQSIAVKENTQVIVSSHTPAIIKRIKPESICHFQITKEYRTLVNTILLPEKAHDAFKYVREAIQNYPEIYFAKLVVIGEGDSEDVLFNRLMAVKKVDFDDNIITFAPLGHRFVNHIWKLLDVLNIPYITLLDLDTGRNGGGWGRVKYVLQQLIERGADPKKLLEIEGGGIADLKKMGEWEINNAKELNSIMTWVNFLKKYDVFYSAPLDLDFLMLTHFPEAYKKIVPANGGPRIPDKKSEKDKFNYKVLEGVRSTLKSEKATGNAYNDEEKELMIWYNYHFLNRGKPSTHILALSELSNRELKTNMPPVFNEMFKRITKLLDIETA